MKPNHRHINNGARSKFPLTFFSNERPSSPFSPTYHRGTRQKLFFQNMQQDFPPGGGTERTRGRKESGLHFNRRIPKKSFPFFLDPFSRLLYAACPVDMGSRAHQGSHKIFLKKFSCGKKRIIFNLHIIGKIYFATIFGKKIL